MITGGQGTDNSTQRGVFFGAVAALIWGAWPVISGLGMQHSLSAADLTILRFAVAGLLLAPIVFKRGVGSIGWPAAIVMSLGAGVPYVMAAIGGMEYAPAAHAGIIIPSVMLTCSTLGGWLFFADRPTPMRLAGLVTVLCGVFVIGGLNLSLSHLPGHLMFAGAGFLWASYTLTVKARGADPLHATALVSVLSLAACLPLYLLVGPGNLLTVAPGELLFHGLFQGALVAIVALICYSKAVLLLGAARGALFAAFVPAVAVLLAFLVLGESLSTREIAGLVIVTIGMAAALGLFGMRRTV